MNKIIEIITKPRLGLAGTIEGLSMEQLNHVPPGFNNNIVWNMGHLVATQQIVCYRRAGVAPLVDAEFIDAYAPGSRPDKFVSFEELLHIQDLFVTTLEQFEKDLQTKLFENYTPWKTRYGVEINCIDDIVNFLPFHEGLHVGYIWALKRVLLS